MEAVKKSACKPTQAKDGAEKRSVRTAPYGRGSVCRCKRLVSILSRDHRDWFFSLCKSRQWILLPRILPSIRKHVRDNADFGGELEWDFRRTWIHQFDEKRRVTFHRLSY